jgi:small-conductance mechanosensitive channel
MSEQYYEKEDALPETTSQAIQNWQAQSNSLANVVPEVGQRLQEAGAMLGELYAKAEAEGNTEAMNSISVSWTHMETIANQTVQMDATRQAAAEVIKTIDEERQKVTNELTGFKDDVSDLAETGETDNPALLELVEALNDHWHEDGFHTNCPGCDAIEIGWSDETVGHDDVNDLFRALMSPYFADKIPDEMRDSLGEALRPWLKEWNAYLDELAKQEEAFAAVDDTD